ncbi:hypothetical protein ABFS82_06G092400 [Erythranthe guttata]|uniref:FAS1 domain-containing protein n=1 Tax=Erythranthe guttata TaxID=4155 RepID=A0A022PVB7_ERYGU|nr:PREDICTED: FAS1 domain-containing protein SELMODRAFT_448915-like [Erythranthe guttata]EYU19741.1 hypothetical protein MIMGU_mgv1a027002mg [Erythranthe guttata]|eukprot:XP_012858336.1 PREDICTED: FAS1 domain-containing protein SELMODRAFT_448915-like [Erythranthe guttata]
MSLLIVVLTAVLVSSSAATAANPTSQDIVAATQEMQKANYFTFVMLVKMAAPSNTIPNDVTFLMPNDRALSNITDVSETTVVDFLLRHSIPTALLIDHLEHFPTGSMIPASKAGFMFNVTNEGRRRIYLNNVRIISPNICTGGYSIRCHGIDGVVQPQPQRVTVTQPPAVTCSNGTTPPADPPVGGSDVAPPVPSNRVPVKSGCRREMGGAGVIVTTLFTLALVKLWM